MIEVYNSLAVKNEKDKFVPNLILGMGYPLWKHSFIYENKTIKEDLILIPLAKGNDERVSGIITATRAKEGKYKGEFIINAMSRNVALGKGKKEVDKYGRCSYLKGFSGFDRTIFNTQDNELEDLACGCEDLDNPPSTLSGDCTWNVVTICTDLDNQVSWVATTSTLPFHLDHDRDGIPNSEDQDWYDFSQRFNVTQEDFEQIIQDWIEETREDLNFDDPQFNTPFEWNLYYEDIYYDFIHDRWPFPELSFPERPPEIASAFFDNHYCGDGLLQGDTRNVRCDNYYVKICGNEAGGPNWQDHYTEVVLCDDCEGLINSPDAFRERLYNFWRNEDIARRMDFSSFMNIVGSSGSCDALSPGFESCALGALALHDLEQYSDYITLTEDEEAHILSFEPLLAVEILDFLQVNGQDPMAVQAVHDLIALQSCSSGGENCVVTDYQNNLAIIQTLYGELSNAEFLSLIANEQVRLGIVAGVLLDNNAVDQVSEVIELIISNGLNPNVDGIGFLLTNSFHREKINIFLDNHTNDIAAAEFINEHSNRLGADAEYASFVESSFNWSPVMWSIAKELIGDKVIDIVLRFIPGYTQTTALKNSIKAISHGDPIEFFYEVGKLAFNNTFLGQALKAWGAFDELYDFYKKTERIWDKIGNFTEAAIQQMWTIVKAYPKALWTNSDLMGSIAKAIHRGIKPISEVMTNIPGFTQMSSQQMRHILHGDATGGLHHASGLVNNPAIQVLEHFAPNAKGVYKVRYQLPNGDAKLSSMFPDNKSEIGVAKSIQHVFNNPTQSDLIENGTKRLIQGTDSGGIPIEIITDFNYNIITAFPKFN